MNKEFKFDKEAITRPKELTTRGSILASLTSLILAGVCFGLIGFKMHIPIVLVGFSVLNLLVFLIFKWTNDLKLVYKLTSILIYITVILVTMLSGGVNSPIIVFVPLVVLSGYAMNKYYGNNWLLVAVLTLVAIYALDDPFIDNINCVPETANNTFDFISIFLVTLIVGGVYGRYLSDAIYRSIKKSRELGDKNTEIEALLKEVQHRVGENLSMISQMLELQLDHIDDASEQIHFKFSQYRVQSMALIHDLLYRSESVSKINFKSYVEGLSTNLQESFDIQKGQTKIDIRSENIFFNIDTALPLGLIVNEILSNSYNNCIAGDTGRINIKLEPLHDDHYILDIMSAGQEKSASTSLDPLSQELVEDLVLKLKGSIEYDNDKPGCHFTIIFQVL